MFSVEEVPEFKVACMRRVGPYGAGNQEQMERLKGWAAASGLLRDGSVVLGIAQDDPGVVAPEDCRYDVCLVVPRDTGIGGAGIEEAWLPGGRYAVRTVAHTAEALARAWAGLLPALADAGFRFDSARPIIERFAPRMVENHLCEICVPVT
ncbi:GyrI-like domain-containing protein [Kitasatospora sp. NPDC001603]|uniref:AraC family transcriptional regulator n=1 Tax=Kitasatospora sp. NPDC001603 TaxID=3154388 RepID=UPI0033189453